MRKFEILSAPMLAALLGEGGKSAKGSKARGGKSPKAKHAETQPLEPPRTKEATSTAAEVKR